MRAWLRSKTPKRPSLLAVSFFKAMAKRPLRIAATADLHYAKHSRGKMQDAFAEISRNADVLLLCGDLTEYGLPEEAEELAADIDLNLSFTISSP